jgi:hypothetical protein
MFGRAWNLVRMAGSENVSGAQVRKQSFISITLLHLQGSHADVYIALSKVS